MNKAKGPKTGRIRFKPAEFLEHGPKVSVKRECFSRNETEPAALAMSVSKNRIVSLGSLPYDLLQAGRRLAFKLGGV